MTVDTSHNDAANALPRIAGYRLLREIGQGGMSTVYLAEQESLGRKVAVKVMLPEALTDEVSRRRFENEARTIARLDHPHIVGIHEVGRTQDDLPYYAMPFLSRGHLGQRIARQNGIAHDHTRIIHILRCLLEALDYAHVRGVVHRDVKAENVLFDDAERPQLADFGIALRKGINPRLTMTGLAVGSTAYMPPEQARGEEVDSRADLYSIGVLAWEMLTGALPFNAADALSMAVMHAKDPIPRLPAELMQWQRFIDRAMAKSPANRFRSAQQMLEALDRIERGGFSIDAMFANVAMMWRRMRVMPKPMLIGGGLLCAAMIGVASQNDRRVDDFFRVEALPTALRKPIPADPVDRMLQPLPPESPATKWITTGEAQLASRKITAPKDDNAYESVIAAFEADSDHEALPPLLGSVLGALGDEMATRLRKGDEDKAREYRERATTLAERTAPLGTEALKTINEKAADALRRRVASAEKRRNRNDALAAASLANEFAGDQALADSLRARAEKIVLPEEENIEIAAGDDAVARAKPTLRPLTRSDYARFVAATGRASSLCREKLSVLRIVKPRDWKAPGFEQTESQPVVCVSYEDAKAYARWASRNGDRVRLPSSDELGASPPPTSGRNVASWLKDGSIAGTGWRGPRPRSVEPTRGYDDVGVRLVHE